MAVIGTLKRLENSADLAGQLRTLAIDLRLRFGVNSDCNPQDRNSPRYIVYAIIAGGELVPIGAAWLKESDGRKYLSAQIDDPSFERPLSFAAFEGKEPGVHDLVWSRPRQAAPAAAA